VRVQTVETLLLFEKELGEDFINDRSILRLLGDRLTDRVYAVRYIYSLLEKILIIE
jgi:hypothetical protein